MNQISPVMLFLTCANTAQADTITNALLEQRLVACVKWIPVRSHFVWEGKKESEEEVLLIMETIAQKYDDIYQEVKKLHSYNTFVLQSIAVEKVPENVLVWLGKELFK